jgi:hypothetical protein
MENKASLFVLQIAFIFLPGIIWERLDARYALKVKPSDTEFILRVFLFGITSYLATFLLYFLIGLKITLVDFSDAASKQVLTADNFKEIGVAIVIGFLLAVAWIAASNHKLFTRFLQWIGATKTYGDEDVWDFTLNSKNAEVEYAHFRDFSNNLVYAGWINTFSETEKLRELLLRDVQVYDFGGKKLFDTPLLYIARNPENIHIEFPYKR